MTTARDSIIALRLARHDERALMRRLADLDDAAPLGGEVLAAFVDGEAVAALSLADGRSVANPFVPTADLLALLRLRAEHLSRAPRQRRAMTRLRPRIAAGPGPHDPGLVA
jgi:hypothetical protein